MKSSSILVPTILIVCLLALALLISQAFAARGERDVVLEDSVNPTISATSAEEDSIAFYDAQPSQSRQTPEAPDELVAVSTSNVGTLSPSSPNSMDDDDYFVIAGTFRQVINARARVEELRRTGFSSTEMSKFDRGTYAVALVGRSEDYDEAAGLAERVRAAGFEAKVYRKR